MKLIRTGSTDPFYNLACEEYFLRYSDEDVFMLWQNEPSVIIGRNQNMYAEVDLDYVKEAGVHVARRITGGGAVFHDLGNINYSFITSREKAEVLDFAYFSAPILKALTALGLKIALNGRNDLVAALPDGSTGKCSGAAETATKTRILHHGTLLYDSDMEALSKALKPDEEKLKSKAIKSVRSRVVNLRTLLTGTDFKKAFSALLPDKVCAECAIRETLPAFGAEAPDTAVLFEYLFRFAEREWNCVREDADENAVRLTGLVSRNESEDYNAGVRNRFEVNLKKRFPSGIVVFRCNLCGNRIQDASLEGDFFGTLPAEELAGILNGTEKTEEAILKALLGYAVADYIAGVSNAEFAAFTGGNGS